MKIAVVGSYGVGFTMQLRAVPEAGETIGGGVFSVSHGGKGSNQAVAAARLGADVSLLTAVGEDDYGKQALKLWDAERINASYVRTVGESTMAGIILVESSGENRIVIAPGALDSLTIEDVEDFRPKLAEADIAIISLEIPLKVALTALRIAHEEGTCTLLNPAPARTIPSEAWNWVDVVTPNRSEAEILAGPDFASCDPQVLAEQIRRLTGTTVVLTLGGDGTIIVDGRCVKRLAPMPATRVVDSTGAGDSFTGALAYAIAAGQPFNTAVGFAMYAGAYTVTYAEVIPGLATVDDLPSFEDIDTSV